MRRDIQGSGIVLVAYVHCRIIDEGSGSSKGGVLPDTLCFPVESTLCFPDARFSLCGSTLSFPDARFPLGGARVGIECFAAFG
jgi:hypothetical protein